MGKFSTHHAYVVAVSQASLKAAKNYKEFGGEEKNQYFMKLHENGEHFSRQRAAEATHSATNYFKLRKIVFMIFVFVREMNTF